MDQWSFIPKKHFTGSHLYNSLVGAPDLWSKGCKFKFCQENFLLQSQLCVMTLIPCSFHPHVTEVARKRPWSFYKKCRWQVTPNRYTTLTQWGRSALTLLSRPSVGTYQGKELTSNSSENAHLAISACSATVKGAWPEESNWCRQAYLHF